MMRTGAWIRRNGLSLSLGAIFIVCSVLMVKSSSDANQILFDSSVGINVSLLIYFLVVWLPEWRKRTRVRRNLQLQYDSFKEATVHIILSASGQSYDLDTTDRLKDPKQFRDFFKESVSPSQNRWHAFLNGLDEYHVKQLVIECEILMAEVHFTLSAIDVDNQDAFALLKRLTQSLHRSKDWSPDYDDAKRLSQFLWSVHTGWSFVEGYPEKDVIAQMIEAI